MARDVTELFASALDSLRREWVAAAADSDVGLWWVAQDIRECLLGEVADDELRRFVLEVLRPLLESGQLRAVDLGPDGSFTVWPGDADEQLNRIEQAWKDLGKTPVIGDIVWFIGPR